MDKYLFDGEALTQIDPETGEIVTTWTLSEEQRAKLVALLDEVTGKA